MGMSPFRGRGFYDLQSEMNRMFDEAFGSMGGRPRARSREQVTEWTPSVDVLQKGGDLIVRAELPGVKPEDINIAVQDRVLNISGERKVEQEEERGGYFVRERKHGSFRRSMTLPEGVEEDSIRARFEDGVLEVTLQGAAAIREPRRIQIEGTGSQRGGTADVGVSGEHGGTIEASPSEEEGHRPPR